MPKVKKIPQRQCVGCREMKDKKSLLRVVRSPEGQVSLDFGGKKPGRGAYVCHNVECLRKARKTRALERAFEVTIPPEVYDAMEAELGVKLFVRSTRGMCLTDEGRDFVQRAQAILDEVKDMEDMFAAADFCDAVLSDPPLCHGFCEQLFPQTTVSGIRERNKSF
mgnify:CR=1 FL=1